MGFSVIKGNTTIPLPFFMQDSAASRFLGKTGLSPTVTISKNGATFATPAGAISEVGNGWYIVSANATDANTSGPLLLHATASGADPTTDQFLVVSYDPHNPNNLGLDDLSIVPALL